MPSPLIATVLLKQIARLLGTRTPSPPAIPTDELRKSAVPDIGPRPSSAAYARFAEYALSFNGYVEVEDCGRLANAVLREYQRTGTMPTSVEVLRACVFFEQRRFRHFGAMPDDRDWAYLNALLTALREAVPS